MTQNITQQEIVGNEHKIVNTVPLGSETLLTQALNRTFVRITRATQGNI